MTTFPTHRRRLTDIAVLIAVTAAVAWMVRSVPSWRDATAGPSLAATLATVGVVAFLWVSLWGRGWVTLWWGRRAIGIQAESWLLAAFLCGMPVIYVAQYLATMDAKLGAWFWLEVAGIAIFVAFAVLGVKVSPWFLVVGIVAHGLAWDSWHYRHSAYIADWYSTGCLLVDITIGAYAAVRLSMSSRGQLQ